MVNRFESRIQDDKSVAGPLVVVKKVRNAAYNEIVRIKMPNGEERLGQVLESTDKHAVVQVFGHDRRHERQTRLR